MAQPDASKGGSVAAAGHSRVIDMALRLDTNGRRCSCYTAAATYDDDDKDHVVISMNAGDKGSTGSDDIPSCVVCMEPLEWVAVGPCGHRVICSVCAARARSAPNSDHRCCICRTLCPTVIVTKAATATNGVPAFSKMPAAFQDGRVGEYWYCTAMTAYFDDEWQYEATANAVATLSLKQRQPPSNADDETLRRHVADDGGAPGNDELGPVQFLIFAIFLALGGAFIGICHTAEATGWDQRVAIVLGSAALLVTLGSVIWFSYKNGTAANKMTLLGIGLLMTTSSDEPFFPP